MDLVIDANPFIAGFLKDSTSRRIMLLSKLHLYSPDWLEHELSSNEKELIEKFSNADKFSETKSILLEFVTLVPQKEYSEFVGEASKLTKHAKDIPYFALALKLKCPIWSNEKSFKSQSKVKVYDTSELVREFNL